MTLPQAYNFDEQEMGLNWQRLRPSREVDDFLPPAPRSKRVVSESALQTIVDLQGTGAETKQPSFDVGVGFDREHIDVKWFEGAEEALVTYADRPWIAELFDAYCAPGSSDKARAAAKEILSNHHYPLLDEGRQFVAWAWDEGSIYWSLAPTAGFLASAQSADSQCLHDRMTGSIVGSWSVVAKDSRFEEYLPPECSFHWARLVTEFLRWGDALMALPEEGSGLTPQKAWQKVSFFAFVQGYQLATFHARRRHSAAIAGGHASIGSVNKAALTKKQLAEEWKNALRPYIIAILEKNPLIQNVDVYRNLKRRAFAVREAGKAGQWELDAPLRKTIQKHRVHEDETTPSEASVKKLVATVRSERAGDQK